MQNAYADCKVMVCLLAQVNRLNIWSTLTLIYPDFNLIVEFSCHFKKRDLVVMCM